MIKFVAILVPLYFTQQFIHELAHGTVAIIFGGKINGIYFNIYGGRVDSVIPNIPYVILLTGLSGGLIASLILMLVYFATRAFWVEFNILTVAFSLTNLFTGIIEGLFYDSYVSSLSSWSYIFLPFFLLSAYIFRRKLITTYPKPRFKTY